MNIPTLYEKLLPEAKSGLESNEDEYKASVDAIVKALKTHTCWLNLTVLELSLIHI